VSLVSRKAKSRPITMGTPDIDAKGKKSWFSHINYE
jgi:hypothetical protein